MKPNAKITLEGIGKSILNSSQQKFLNAIEEKLKANEKLDNPKTEKIASEYHITDKTEIKELSELAVVNVAREIAKAGTNSNEVYTKLVNLYQNQMIMAHRTSQSILLQQYSTPVPIGYLMGLYCGLDRLKENELAFEPSAGNGMLTVAAHPSKMVVNEIDPFRNKTLLTQGFYKVYDLDGSDAETFVNIQDKFKAVLTNPPFGVYENPVKFGKVKVRVLDHLMCLRALTTLRRDGRAALIIGGHTTWDKLGRISEGKNRIFLSYLYHYYHVEAVLNIDGKRLYTRQGTGFPVRLILIGGRKTHPEGFAPLFDEEKDRVITSFHELYERVSAYIPLEWNTENLLSKSDSSENVSQDNSSGENDLHSLETEAERISAYLESLSETDEQDENKNEILRNSADENANEETDESSDELGQPYTPASNACVVLNTQVPDAMGQEIHDAVNRIKDAVGGDVDNFVRHRLKYNTHEDLCNALSAEQIDAVSMAIYNIEAREQGMIIGDQTGIGKGRIAAAMIRYACMQGIKPIFLTEKVNLFSDLYRDLAAIGSASLRPLIINARDNSSNIKDEDGKVVYTAPDAIEQESIFESGEITDKYDFVMATYSQFNSIENRPTKPKYLDNIVTDSVVIMDESHNASGLGNTGFFMRNILRKTKGVVFLSATFAKTPENMPIYAKKTSIKEANISEDMLISAMQKGGVALQEILSSQLVAEGQMIRRERSSEGVEVNYIHLDNFGEQHQKRADALTQIVRDIILFQKKYVRPLVTDLNKDLAQSQANVDIRSGTNKAGIDNIPYFSKVFQIINQMLFSLKSEAVAMRAIERLKEGKKPVIAFSSTMGSFIESMVNENGQTVSDGDVIPTDFSLVLKKGLDGVMRYTVKDAFGNQSQESFGINELGLEGAKEYRRILNSINSKSSGLNISPIDVIVKILSDAGYKVAEVTGRKFVLDLNLENETGTVLNRKRISTNDAFRAFNNNEVDVLLINQSGSTGASAHAVPTSKVPASEVKQRVMLVLQAELDINTEVQKRGRIHRTGQIHKPIYDYIISSIPAEQRLMMMLQMKLKSLDANTTSNQKQSTKILDVPDFLNKYGDVIMKSYLEENPEINDLLDNPLKSDEGFSRTELAHKTSGRVAVLPVSSQMDFYNEIITRYNEYITYLKQTGEYDLEVEAQNLEAKTLSKSIYVMGKGGNSLFAQDSILEEVEVNNLRKPYTSQELTRLLETNGYNQDVLKKRDELIEGFEAHLKHFFEEHKSLIIDYYTDELSRLGNSKELKKLREEEGEDASIEKYKELKSEIEKAQSDEISKLEAKVESKRDNVKKYLEFFYTGKVFNFPIIENDLIKDKVLGVCIGIDIDLKKKNPYAPSSIKIKIAVANGLKYVAIPLSQTRELNSIIVNNNKKEIAKEELLNIWNEAVKSKLLNRVKRYIVTGNILQAFKEHEGKLISYTTQEGKIKKGILLSEEFQWDKHDEKIAVPVSKAYTKILNSYGTILELSESLKIYRNNEDFVLTMPLSRKSAGHIYTHKGLMELMKKGLFEKAADKMKGIFHESKLKDVLGILQNEFSSSILILQREVSDLDLDSSVMDNYKPIVLPPTKEKMDADFLELLELEAEAIQIELDLLEL